MTEGNDHEGFRIIEGGDPVDDDDVVMPGRSVFGDDDQSYDDDDAALPHWSEPATGAVPQVGAPASTSQPVAPSVDDEPMLIEAQADEMDAWADVSSTPRWAGDGGDLPPIEPTEQIGHDATSDDFFGYDDQPVTGIATGYTDTRPPPVEATVSASASGRDMPAAVAVGAGLAGVILLAMAAGPAIAMVVVTIALGLAAVEFFNAVRVAGHHPAVLLGLAAVVTMPLGVYYRGEVAISVVLVLSVVFGGLWYLTGVGTDAPLRGLGVTILGIVYIGVLGSHAALLLTIPASGTGLLTGAILVTVAYDIGGLAVGRAAGRTPLSAASPNKTVEGLVGGCVAAVVVGLLMAVLSMPAPIADGPGGLGSALLLGIVAAVVAPIGDLTESLLKRDLGIKDFGAILPGHGGVLDRFDALLFVLPATYYVAVIADLF